MMLYIAWGLRAIPYDLPTVRARMWKRLAFASRYSSTPLSELLDLDSAYLSEYCQALAEILKEENTTKRGPR